MKEGKKIGVWFRNDLRIHDHQPLIEALNKAPIAIPIYCFDPRTYTVSEGGTSRTGSFRAGFLLQSVHALRDVLRSKGADLVILRGNPEEELVKFIVANGISQLLAFKEVTAEEIGISDLVEEKLWKHKVSMEFYLGNTLFNKEDLPFPVKDIPDTFQVFKKRIERDSHVRPCFQEPESISFPEDLDTGTIPTLEELGFKESVADARAVLKFKGGEKAGLERLHEYIWEKELIKNYKNTRNGLLGSDYSSKLSPWLSLGCISPRKVYHEIKAYELGKVSNSSTQGLFYEILWRDYFRFIFKKYGSSLFMEAGIKGSLPLREESTETGFLDKWKNGLTGIPFIDANMRELSASGFMSNRGRQVVASFLIYDCKVRWTLGAAWFEEVLIDYNPATNWGNWAFTAGVGNDPKINPRMNIIKQASDFDSKGEYVKYWIPELKTLPPFLVHQPWTMTPEQELLYGVKIGNNYPFPMVELDKLQKKV